MILSNPKPKPPPIGKKPLFPPSRTNGLNQNPEPATHSVEKHIEEAAASPPAASTEIDQSNDRGPPTNNTMTIDTHVQNYSEQATGVDNGQISAIDPSQPDETFPASTVPLPNSASQNNGMDLADGIENQASLAPESALDMPLPEQLANLLARIRQLEEHPTTTLNRLEARVNALEQKENNADSGSAENEGEKTGLNFCKADTCLNIMTVNEFDERKFNREQPHAAIDVIVAPDFFHDRKDSTDGYLSPLVDDSLRGRFEQSGDRQDRVKFIQVNSAPFRHLYQYVLGADAGPEPMVIVAPFKSCTIFEEDYQQMLDSLGEKYKDCTSGDSRTQVSIRRHGTPPEQDQTEASARYEAEDLHHDSYEAFLALKCWQEFYQRFVKPRWHWLRSSKVESVQFGDLCDLFQPGDDVYEPGNAQRVWRVYKITGGRPTLPHLLYGKSEAAGAQERTGGARISKHQHVDAQHAADEDAALEASNVDSNWTSLFVEGYYLDFNGTDYGPVHKKVQLKYFPGKKSARNLKIWPLRLLKDDPDEYDRLTRPGVTFFEKCQPALHNYDGRTLTETPNGQSLGGRSQDVTSAVYVDFAKSFQYNPDWAPEFFFEECEAADFRETSISTANDVPIGSKFRSKEESAPEFLIEYLEYADQWAFRKFRQTDEWARETVGDRNSVKRADQILFPNRLFGFVFQTRDWACFDVDEKHLRDVTRDDRAWNELALPDSYKQTLESLIELYFANKKAMAMHGKKNLEFDFIHGKGSGLVVLLHGHPGVGKTSTAESIALKYQKPLLPITCGNLGINAESVEQNLNENFQLAQAWDAIVLLDEADIFLTRRNKTDLERNALVSVFLRTLEYYTGILFLTTNRVGAFDGAFISRVHCSLYYPPLKLEQSEKIWTNNLRRLLRQPRLDGTILNVDGIGEEIMDFARSHFIERQKQGSNRVWNGRQIRNSFQTAVALAEYEVKERREKESDPNIRVVLRSYHFETVARASAEFEKYLDLTRDSTEAEILDQAGERAAEYSTPTPLGHSQHGAIQQPSPQPYGGWTDGAHVMPGTPTPNPDFGLNRRPTFNSRISQERQHQASMPSQTVTYPQGTAVASSLPPGYAIVMTPQGQQVVQLPGMQAPPSYAVHTSPGQIPQHFVQQANAGAPSDHEHHNTPRSSMAGSSLQALNRPLIGNQA